MTDAENKIYKCDHKIRVQVKMKDTGNEFTEYKSICKHIDTRYVCKLCLEISYYSSATINKDSKYD
jgi:hypothetical protein